MAIDVRQSLGRPELERAPLAWVGSLYGLMALPYTAVATLSLLVYKGLGSSDTEATVRSAWLLLPWALKPFFSPLVEMIRQRRLVLVALQLALGVVFAGLSLSLYARAGDELIFTCFALLAMNSAVHDILSDGLFVTALAPHEQAKYIGLQSGANTLGQTLTQGGIVTLVGWWQAPLGIAPAWGLGFMILGGLCLAIAGYHGWVLPRSPAAYRTIVGEEGRKDLRASSTRQVWREFREICGTFFTQSHLASLVAFAIFYRIADTMVDKIIPLFLLAPLHNGGLGWDTATLGMVSTVGGLVGNVAGALIGSWWVARWGLARSLFPLALVFNLPCLLFGAVAYWPEMGQVAAIAMVCAQKLLQGIGFTTLWLVLMQGLAAGRFSTAHYGFATALVGTGVMVFSAAAGKLSDWLGYAGFFGLTSACALISIAVTYALPHGIFREVKATIHRPIGERDIEVLHEDAGFAVAQAVVPTFLLLVLSGFLYGDRLPPWQVGIVAVVCLSGFVISGLALQSGRNLRQRAMKIGVPTPSLVLVAKICAGISFVLCAAASFWLMQGCFVDEMVATVVR